MEGWRLSCIVVLTMVWHVTRTTIAVLLVAALMIPFAVTSVVAALLGWALTTVGTWGRLRSREE